MEVEGWEIQCGSCRVEMVGRALPGAQCIIATSNSGFKIEFPFLTSTPSFNHV